MRIGFLTSNQKPTDEPHSYVSKGVAIRKIKRGLADPVCNKAGKLIRVIECKTRRAHANLRFKASVPVKIEKLKPPRKPETLILRYPHPDESSYAKQHRRDIWTGSRLPSLDKLKEVYGED